VRCESEAPLTVRTRPAISSDLTEDNSRWECPRVMVTAQRWSEWLYLTTERFFASRNVSDDGRHSTEMKSTARMA